MNSNKKLFCLIISKIFQENFRINKDKLITIEDIIFLKQNLLNNLIENISIFSNENYVDIFVLLSNDEINIIEDKFFENKFNSSFIKFVKENITIKESFRDNYKNYFFIYSDVMGISSRLLNTSINLLAREENMLILSKSSSNDVCFIAKNKFDEKIFDLMLNKNLSYEEFLASREIDNFFIYTLTGTYRVNNFSSLKLLYSSLSNKESTEYCSQQMHENFTNLFIEYRDYIK